MSELNPFNLPADELSASAMWKWLETPEFVQWFKTWYGDDSIYDLGSANHDGYLQERHFACVGWIAGRMSLPPAHAMKKEEFVARLRKMYENSRAVLP